MRGRPTWPQGGAVLRVTLVVLAASWAAIAGCALGATAGAASSPPRAAEPDDPLFRHQWNLRAIGIPAAWAISRGAGATVAILDTGVAYRTRGRHRQAPDLAGTRFAPGWDFVDGDPYPDDLAPGGGRRSHGTLMAGIIAQSAGNGIGAAGIAPEATIMPVRVLEPHLMGTARALARGLRYAADHGAAVINLSIAGPTDTRAVARAVAYATAKGATVVAAAGNGGRPAVGWPAADPRVIAVGAVARDRSLAPYSNYGERLDIVAPGGAGELGDSGKGPPDGVLAQTLEGPSDFCFCFSASTSAAAAHVSGVAALLVGSGRAPTRDEVRRALLAGARDLGAHGRDPRFGAGLVQARGALEAAAAASGAAAPGVAARPSAHEGVSTGWPVAAVTAGALAGLLGLWLTLRRRRGESGHGER